MRSAEATSLCLEEPDGTASTPEFKYKIKSHEYISVP
jgi:hypothetical protein